MYAQRDIYFHHLGRKKAPMSKTNDLCRIPGVGKKRQAHVGRLGDTKVDSLKGQDPEAIYAADCRIQGRHVDRCVLYVYRCAVYFAENEQHEPEKLKWWNWKD